MENQPHDLDQLAARLLAHVRAADYQPVKPRVLARQLGLSKERVADLKTIIKRLIKQGELAPGSKQVVKPAKAREGRADRALITGIFRRASGGFGFVRPRVGGSSQPADRSSDIYVSQRKTLDAADGDLVAVRVKERIRGGEKRWRGEIVEVLERQSNRFVGVYFERSGYGFVRVDSDLFANPIFVGDPGAKNAVTDDKVVIEMVRFPSHAHEGEAVIIEVLGPRGEPGVDTLSVIREFNLPERFSEEVMQAARDAAAAFEETLDESRDDFTALTTLTIDPKDARDFDDAISLEILENGHWHLGVHIADVSHFVSPKSALDQEARDRGTSVYLPDRVIPMLPEIISNNLASLQPGRVRYTKTVLIEFTAEGVVTNTSLHNSAIRSRHRFTYEEIDSYLADPEAWRSRLSREIFDLLDRMHTLAMLLRKRRLDHGSIELTLPEVKIDLNNRGEVKGAHVVEHTESHQIIEEFMLAANEAVADELNRHELNFLRRIHTAPDPRKLRDLTQFVRELGITCESLESRFEIKRVVAEVAGRPEEHAVNFAILRSMQKAVYSPEVERHYALHSDNYCHFTSPIRRYPDLVIHRMVTSLLADQRPPDDFDHMALLGEHCSQREQRAERAERELNKVKLLRFLSQQIGQQMDAVITGVERFGLFAQGVELPAEGLIHINALQDDHYHYDPQSHSLSGHRGGNCFRLGDLLRVEVAHVDVDRRELDFRLVSRYEATGAEAVNQEKSKAKRKTARKKQPSAKRKKATRKAKSGKRGRG
jgi:ribonuclease R